MAAATAPRVLCCWLLCEGVESMSFSAGALDRRCGVAAEGVGDWAYAGGSSSREPLDRPPAARPLEEPSAARKRTRIFFSWMADLAVASMLLH